MIRIFKKNIKKQNTKNYIRNFNINQVKIDKDKDVIKVIDLLNIIADDRCIPPKKVKIITGTLKDEYRIWIWEGCWYVYETDGEDVLVCTERLELNDVLEIIEV